VNNGIAKNNLWIEFVNLFHTQITIT